MKLPVISGFIAFSVVASDGAVLLTTDFSGRTVSGATASNVSWTETGLSGPGSLTVVNEAPGALAGGGLFDTGNAQGHFAVSKNIGNQGPWSVTVPVALTGDDVSLESIDLDWQHFSNGGALQGPSRNVRWTVTVTGSSSGLLGTVIGTANAPNGFESLVFSSPLDLDNSETYDVKILVDNNGNNTGNNSGFDGISFNGEIVPEPSSTLLSLLGVALVIRRRR